MLNKTHRMTGTVKWYNEEKGFGFITSDMNSEDVFLHHTALQQQEDVPIVTGDRITFTIQKQEKGPAALEVQRFAEKKELGRSEQTGIDTKFNDLDLRPELLRAIRDAGYIEPTPIQTQAIPIVLKGQDLLGCAQTGTGKTAAFALPILQRLMNTPSKDRLNIINNNKYKIIRKIRVLVLSPTRELAIQIANSFGMYGKYTGLRNAVIYGGVSQNPQVAKLRQGVDIVVATPGRLLDLMRQGHVKLNHVEVLVLDEGDRMLDMGFIHDIRSIVKMVPQKNRQTMLFSATIPREVIKFAKDILDEPVEINISPDEPTLEIIKQAAFFILKEKKQALLEYLLSDSTITRALVFTRTKHGANRVVKKLQRRGIRAESIHGNKSQSARQIALKNFRTGKARVLVATDVASRGLDIDNISHVIQFDLPDVPETYLHRIGRTARAGAGGTAFAFCEKNQHQQLKEIEQLIRMRVKIVKNHPYTN
ncbi:MAG: DEAD/DEAH box helicase [Candidatus Lokiarchaeota archaeon]|nr:DEAD/DEAH box helicase [Candidatus Lokiarchaeota archaeon]